MKAVILAGGFGTRLAEETDVRPKPMVEIGGKPILWHIMKTYSEYGIKDFVILLGYKSYYIKEYFLNYSLHQSDVTINTQTGDMTVHSNKSEDWNVTLVDTGLNAMTGARIKRAQKHIGNETFLLTYGDGVADINIDELVDFHRKSECGITMTSYQPEGRFGSIDISESGKVNSFQEKPLGDGSWINAGYFVCEPMVFDYLDEDETCVFEQAPLRNLASEGHMMTFKHQGFWKPMDALRDKQQLQEMWDNNEAAWKVW
ncbi:glucose-1-phosphate cytidylyltransferase [Vibrio barjaei]|uniref:glucose-1-phosphate cytidylyltransferase n=1 Tax=Vibrio barjaei TaxID=1676683 RepID=UPI0007BB523B|nr:glucose-1-phosphate cytidylyltransferase [Vibrio barjaei]OIN25465.1 glucose-1-phosphate cytidylyltransferase [Vibrio barjaei]